PPVSLPGEPPLAPPPGPVVSYTVRAGGETLQAIARHTLGSGERWGDIHKLNPSLPADGAVAGGTTIRLPGDACIAEEAGPVKAPPALRAKAPPAKAKAPLPLTGTFPVTLDEKKVLLLPKALREQLGNCDTVLLSPGTDQCLWLTSQDHLDRMAEKLEKS